MVLQDTLLRRRVFKIRIYYRQLRHPRSELRHPSIQEEIYGMYYHLKRDIHSMADGGAAVS